MEFFVEKVFSLEWVKSDTTVCKVSLWFRVNFMGYAIFYWNIFCCGPKNEVGPYRKNYMTEWLMKKLKIKAIKEVSTFWSYSVKFSIYNQTLFGPKYLFVN